MILSFVTCARRLVGAALVLAPLLGHAQGRTTVVGAAAKTAPAVAAAPVRTATLTGRVSGPTADSVAISLRENPLDPKEKLFRVPLNDKGDFKVMVPVGAATKADLVYGDDVAPLFLDPGTDMDVRFKGSDMSGTLRFKPNDVPSGFATRLRNRANLTDEQRHRQQAANANNYLVEADAQFVENDGFQVLPDNIQLYEAPFLSFLEYRSVTLPVTLSTNSRPRWRAAARISSASTPSSRVI